MSRHYTLNWKGNSVVRRYGGMGVWEYGSMGVMRLMHSLRLTGYAPFVVFMLLAPGWGSCGSSPERNQKGLRAEIVRVVDGDTFDARLEASGKIERLRLIGIDSPEKHPSPKLDRQAEEMGQSREVIEALGERATGHAETLALGRRVVLVFDDANAAGGHRDRYDRLLVYVYVTGEDGLSAYCVNERMIEDGYAYALTSYPFDSRRQEQYRRLERLARSAQRGLWNSEVM